MSRKVCGICKQRRLIKFFSKQTCKDKVYFKSSCKECISNRSKEWRTNNPVRSLEAARRWKKANSTRIRLSLAISEAIKRGYKPPAISFKQFNILLEQHSNTCDIDYCTRVSSHLDHDHTTGQVRGLLCPQHNMGMGLCGDSLPALTAVVKYLQKSYTKHYKTTKKSGKV